MSEKQLQHADSKNKSGKEVKMLYATLTIVILLILLDRATRKATLDRLQLGMRFKLFALRDELRLAAIQGQAPYGRWFEYLDTTITKFIDNLQDINVWEISAFGLSHLGDESIALAWQDLEAALAKDENRKLAEIYEKTTNCVLNFLVLRHKTTVGISL